MRGKTEYGIKEIFYFPRRVDVFLRYFPVAERMALLKKESKQLSVLDVGGASGNFERFFIRNFNIKKEDFQFTILDIKDVEQSDDFAFIQANAYDLPFEDNYFDIVISISCLEHLSKRERKKASNELKRVTRDKLFILLPIESNNGEFLGKEYDIKYQELWKNRFGEENPSIAEHLNEYPTMQEFQEYFQSSKMIGVKNAKVWLKYHNLKNIPVFGFFAGFIYYIFWRRLDNCSPYRNVLITWEKRKKVV